MPAEPTKAKLKRRTSRRDIDEFKFDGSHAREIELKRNRGEISCAECRRLKIKCDKQIPCQSCQRRGCAALCPNGSLATGQGTRFVLAATEHLHRRISKLSGRIRLLEDALASLQAKTSTEPHPLLHEDLISNVDVDDGTEDPTGPSTDEGGAASSGQSPDVIDAFGTLSISDHGISRFFGPTGGSESLLMANMSSSHGSPETAHTPDSMRSSKSPSSAGDLSLFSQAFPFTPMGQPADIQEMVESHLPAFERALFLGETYFEQVAWIFHGVTRVQLIDEMLPILYRKRPSNSGADDYSGPHDLALIFVVFAVASLVEADPSHAQAEHFHQISRVALSLQPVLEKPSIVTIQTLHLMSIYNAMSGNEQTSETSMEMTWSLITLAAHLSQTIGLHRDSARWGLSPEMVRRRRILFWDLFVADSWQSLNTGRPPSFSLAYVDCSFPQYEHPKDKEGDDGQGFESWQFRFAAECVADVAARTLTAEAPSYTTIMELDRKVREFSLPERSGPSTPANDLATSFQRFVLDHIRETILLYIHRSFFAQAIIEQPINPLKSPYAPSFLAAYRASSTILKSVRDQFKAWPKASSIYWTMWTFCFSAAVVFGTVVTRGPRSPLATSAMAELDQACILFSQASLYSRQAAKALPILTKLSEKARYALASVQNDPSPSSTDSTGGLLWNIKQEEDPDDELSIFAGHTRFVSAKRSYASSSSASRSPPQADVQYEMNVSPPGYVPDPCQPGPSSFQTERAPSMMQTWVPDQGNEYITSQPLPSSNRGGPSHYQPAQQYTSSDRGHSHTDPSNYAWSAHHQQQHQQQQQRHHQHPHQQQPYNSQPQYIDSVPALNHQQHYQPQPHSHPHQHQRLYIETPSFPGGPIVSQPNPVLRELGLAAPDSRLDARWSSFMEDSGLLEGINYRSQ